MRLRQPELRRARIEIIPMIDTIFFLLVFFMITWVTIVKSSGLELTRFDSVDTGGNTRPTIELSVSATGNYFVDATQTTPSLWRPRLRTWLAAQQDGAGVVVVSVAPSQKTRTLLAVLTGVNHAMADTHRRAQLVLAPGDHVSSLARL